MANQWKNIHQAWHTGASVREIVKDFELNLEIPAHIAAWTKDTVVQWTDLEGNRTYTGKIAFWGADFCIVEYYWDKYPIKRMIEKENIPNLKEQKGE